ncbi:MAG TPA: DNA polymerase IV [Thermoleophilaceae bacterium]|jgi:DNA polymerase-4|nr:DNA polymerase IV [Thermoleophilaceae bacterium]
MRDWPRCYAHADVDAFYVAVELQRRPELKGLPVVVAGTGPRAVVTTASYEARKFGVFSATPAERARRLCPDAVFLPPDFELYRARSRDVFAVFRDHVDQVEAASLDEAYLDLTGLERPKAAARRIKNAVQERTGLTCSIGIGPNKLVAKVASDAEKPNGFVVLTRQEARERFKDASPGMIPGIGPRTTEKLRRGGVTTLAQLRRVPVQQLIDAFGPGTGPYLLRLANFDDDREVTPVRPAKSESRETTFDTDIRDQAELERILTELSAQLCDRLVTRDQRGRNIGIKVRLDDFSTFTRATTIAEPTNDAATITPIAIELLRAFDAPRPVRLLGVRVAGLDEEAARSANSLDQAPQLALPL